MSNDDMIPSRISPGDLLTSRQVERPAPPRAQPGQVSATTTNDTSVRLIEPTCVFNFCDGSGFYKYAVPATHADFGKLQTCRCKKLNDAERAKARTAEVLARLASDMGAELAAATLDNYDLGRAENAKAREMMTTALDTCRAYLARPSGWLYLYGPTGVGKSHLAAATCRAVAATWNLHAAYTSEPDLFRYLREGYQREMTHGDAQFIDADERMAALQKVAVLMIDDLGTAHRGKATAAASWADAQLIDLLYQRHMHNRLTIITSNLHVDDLEARVRSRIRGRTNPDYAGREQMLLVLNADQREVRRHGH